MVWEMSEKLEEDGETLSLVVDPPLFEIMFEVIGAGGMPETIGLSLAWPLRSFPDSEATSVVAQAVHCNCGGHPH
jgi:hypothetical protein